MKKQNIPNILLKKGMKMDIGGGVIIDILFSYFVNTFNFYEQNSFLAG